MARIFRAPPQSLYEVDRVVVTSWYRAPELLLGARHYTTAIDVWALGAVFGEIMLMTTLFACDQNAQADFAQIQIAKTFKTLGRPDPSNWPGVVDMPLWERAQPHLVDCGPRKEARQALQMTLQAGGQQNIQFAEVVMRMLEIDPTVRITCSDAKQFSVFQDMKPRSTASVFPGVSGQSYPKKGPCRCGKCPVSVSAKPNNQPRQSP